MKQQPGGLIGAIVGNPVMANLFALGIIIAGVVSARQLPRETYSDTNVDNILVTVPYPGATPEDIEQSICVKIERAIQGVPGIWELSSIARDNVGLVVAAVDTSISSTADVLQQIRNKVEAISTFPPDAKDPVAIEVIIRSVVINIGIFGDVPEDTIKHVAQQIRDDLVANPEISQVSIAGVRDYEISIKLSEEALQRYGLTFQHVIDAINAGSLDLPAGTVRTQHEEISVRTLGQRYNAADFSELVIIARPDGATVRLGQVAQVHDSFEDVSLYGRVDGQAGAMITVSKTGPEDISEIAAIVRHYVDSAKHDLPEGIHLTTWADASRDVDGRLTMLLKNGVTGMVLVVFALLLFMDLRSTIAVALGIPIAFAGAVAVLGMTDGTINMISLLGLLMATGIVVDDAIVIAEAIRKQTRDGLAPKFAAAVGTRRVAIPVLLSSLTTIAAFIPLMFVEGVMGKLIYVLPVVVIATVVASAIEAFAILPAHLAEWVSEEQADCENWRFRTRKKLDHIIETFVITYYRPAVQWSLSHRGIVLAIAGASVFVSIGLVFGGRTPFVLFPKVNGNTLRAKVRFPEGTPIATTKAAVNRMEQAARMLNDDPSIKPAKPGVLVQHVYSSVGEWAEFVPDRGSAYGETYIELMAAEDRDIDLSLVIERWRQHIGTIYDVEIFTITRQELGPTEKPLEIRLLGEDLHQLRQAADEVKAKLATYEGVFDVTDDLNPGKRELQIRLKPNAGNLGLTVADVASQLRQGLMGGDTVHLQRGDEEVDVVVSYGADDRRSLGAIEKMRLRTMAGVEIPFSEVLDTKLVRGYASIGRQDGRRRIRIQADLDERRANAEQVIHTISQSFLPDITRRFPGVIYLVEGQRARIEESMSSLARGMIIALAIMYALIGLPLRSYIQPMIILGAVPLGMVGSIVGHMIMGSDVTLMSVFGMVALAGIVVNDSLVLVDRINGNMSEGASVCKAVARAGEERFRAVVLTSITTVVGLLPLLFETSSQAQALIPLTISMVFGLMFATLLTLFIVPAMFMVTNDIKRWAYWLRRGGSLPTPECVEHAAQEAVGETV